MTRERQSRLPIIDSSVSLERLRTKVPLSKASKELVSKARDSALRLNHGYIGTEHLLLGFYDMRDDSMVVRFLYSVGISEVLVKREVERLIGRGESFIDREKIVLSPRAARVIKQGANIAFGMDRGVVDPEHIFVGMVDEGEGIAPQVLQNSRQDFFTRFQEGREGLFR